MLADFATLRANAKSPAEIISVNRFEAQWYANLLELNVEGKKDAINRRKFNLWLHNFCLSGYMFDAATDMKEDFDNGNIAVKPTHLNRAVMFKAALREIYIGAINTPVRSLGKVAYVAYRNERPAR